MADRGVLRLTLKYADIISLFEKPDVSPFSEDFLEYGTVPGVEYIYNELQANPRLRRVETTVVLPPVQSTPDLEQICALAVALVLFVVYVLLQWKLEHLEILASIRVAAP